jgi:choline dehydrogenase-like flavoprotein
VALAFFAGNAAAAVRFTAISRHRPVWLSQLMKTGNLKVISNAMVREMLTNKEGLATGVSYVSKDDMQEYQVNAKTVILGASACANRHACCSTHKSAAHPGGLANSSGVVGRYLHDSTGASAEWIFTATAGP